MNKSFKVRVDIISNFNHNAISRQFYFDFYDKIKWEKLEMRNKLYPGFFDSAPRHVKIYIALNYRELSHYL